MNRQQIGGSFKNDFDKALKVRGATAFIGNSTFIGQSSFTGESSFGGPTTIVRATDVTGNVDIAGSTHAQRSISISTQNQTSFFIDDNDPAQDGYALKVNVNYNKTKAFTIHTLSTSLKEAILMIKGDGEIFIGKPSDSDFAQSKLRVYGLVIGNAF